MPDFPMSVHFDFCHNHPILAGDVLRHRDVGPEARERVSQLLQDNHSPPVPDMTYNVFSGTLNVTARHLVVGVSQTLQRCTEGATYVRQGNHHVGHWPTF